MTIVSVAESGAIRRVGRVVAATLAAHHEHTAVTTASRAEVVTRRAA